MGIKDQPDATSVFSILPSGLLGATAPPTAIENADALLKRHLSLMTGEAARSPATAGVAPIAVLASAAMWRPPASWGLLIRYSLIYVAVYSVSAWVVFKPTCGDRSFIDLKTALFHTYTMAGTR
jgi:hypothetical protein